MSNILIEEWSLMRETDIYTAPELIKVIIIGKVYGHPGFDDGELVRTSAIQVLNMPNAEAKTLSHTYTLGTPDPKWVDYLRKTDQSKAIDAFIEKYCNNPS